MTQAFASAPADNVGIRLLDETEKVIADKRQVLEVVLASVLSGNHVLLEDLPGVGKTVLAKALGKILGLEFGRIQGTTDLLPTDITGTHIYNPGDLSWKFRQGPIFSSLLLVDELNRATPKAQSALLEAMAESQVTVDGTTMALPAPFVVIATQNPHSGLGTYPLVAAQLDRFAVLVRLGLPNLETEKNILKGNAGVERLEDVASIFQPGELETVMKGVAFVTVSDAIVDYIVEIVSAFRKVDGVIWLSVRVSQTIAQLAKAIAYLDSRSYVTPEDVQRVTPSVLAHRLPSNFDELTVEGVLHSISVPVDDR